MSQNFPFAKLQVLVVEAEDLDIDTSKSTPELICKISYTGKKVVGLRTEIARSPTKHPKWYEEFVIIIDDLSVPVKFSVKQENLSQLFGTVTINLQLVKPNQRVEQWYPLQLPGGTGHGRIKLVFSMVPQGSLPGNYGKLSRKLPPFRLDIMKSEVDSGGYVEGSVTFSTAKHVDLKRIYLRVYGTEIVSWADEEWENIEHFTGETTLINKWYHGWENDQDSLGAGYYNWKFRIKFPESFPPSYESSYGKISYHLYAYLDHSKYTEGHPLKVFSPVIKSQATEVTQNRHNIQVTCSLNEPVYYKEDCPIRLMIVTLIKNYSDYKIKSIKVHIIENTSYSANNNVHTNQHTLFKQTYRSMQILGHQAWEGKLLADLPVEYSKLTISKILGSTRISCTHVVQITVVKDTPLIENRVLLELPLIITTHPLAPHQDKKQLISLRKDVMVTTPDSPMVPRVLTPQIGGSGGGGELVTPRRRNRGRSKDGREKEKDIGEERTPVPDQTVAFHSPVMLEKKQPDQPMVMSGFTNLYNPWGNTLAPTVTPASPRPTYQNPFGLNLGGVPNVGNIGVSPRMGTLNNPQGLPPWQGDPGGDPSLPMYGTPSVGIDAQQTVALPQYPLQKNPFL